jgi:hypothetical protein
MVSIELYPHELVALGRGELGLILRPEWRANKDGPLVDCPLGIPGDRIAVLEGWRIECAEKHPWRNWQPAATMPLELVRHHLVNLGVTAMRVGDVTEEMALAAGFRPHGPGLCTENPDDYFGCYSAKTAFATDWTTRYHGHYPDGWVWAVRVKDNA